MKKADGTYLVCSDADYAKEIAKKVNSLGFALVGVWVEEVAEAYADALRDRKLVCDVSEE